MKLQGIPDSGLRRIAQSGGLNVLEDPDGVLEVLTQIEGESWARRSVAEDSEYSWGGILQRLEEALEESLPYRDEEDYWELMRDSYVWVLYGDGGYARYRITGDGDISLDAGSTRPERAEKAKSLGMKLY